MNDEPGDEQLSTAREELERVLAAARLDVGDAALWVEPDVALEKRVLALAATEPESPTWSRLRLRVAFTAAVVLIVLVGTVVAVRDHGPDWEVGLFAAQAAPGSSGTARGWAEESGTRIELELAGLEPAGKGFVYELWLSDGPIHVSAGTFRGTTDLTLWAGVDRRDFPRVWITLEPIDGDPAPATNILDSGPAGT